MESLFALRVDRLSFTAWAPWAQRGGLAGVDRPGVYLLARFRSEPPPKADPLDASVLYIGETVRQRLGKRWYDFARSAFKKKDGHSGGWAYRKRVATTPRALYVAALPVELAEPHLGAYVRMVERSLLWAYVDRHGRLPWCNSK